MLGNWLVAKGIDYLAKLPLTDLGAFRAISRTLERLHLEERTYGWPDEMIVKAPQLGVPLCEVPVLLPPRRALESVRHLAVYLRGHRTARSRSPTRCQIFR